MNFFVLFERLKLDYNSYSHFPVQFWINIHFLKSASYSFILTLGFKLILFM